MIRNTIIVVMALLSVFVAMFVVATTFGGFAYCAQCGDSDVKVHIVADAEQRYLEVGVARLLRAAVGPPYQFARSKSDLNVHVPFVPWPMLCVFSDRFVPVEGTPGYGYTAGRGAISCQLGFGEMFPGDAVEHTVVLAYRSWLFVLSVACAAYPTIAFIRGPLRRWRWRRKGLCLKCGYDLEGNVSGVCPECGAEIKEL